MLLRQNVLYWKKKSMMIVAIIFGHKACGIFPNVEDHVPPIMGTQSLNQWTAREVLLFFFKKILSHLSPLKSFFLRT